jgi:hypothetical protein
MQGAMRQLTMTVGLFLTMLTSAASANGPKGGPVARWVRGVFHNISAKHGDARVLHRPGEAYQAALRAPAGSPLGAGTKQVTVRLSRGANAAEPKSDFLGFAVRVPQANGGHDDLLMVSAGDGAVRRRIPSRADSFVAKSYSSLLPFKIDGERFLLRAYPTAPSSPTHQGTDFDQLHGLVAGGNATFRLELQGLHGAKSRPLGELTLQRQLGGAESDALKFDPWSNVTAKPAGLINRLRRWAYEGSQSTR